MKSRQVLTLPALIILGFTVTLAVVWVRSAPGVRPTLPAGVPAPRAWARFVSRVWNPPAEVAAAPGAPAMHPAAPDAEMPATDAAAPPLPLLLAVSSHQPQRADEGEGATSADGLVREVDLLNTSDKPLPITIEAMNVPAQEATSAEVLLVPGPQAHVGHESGLKLEPGYQVVLRSSGYREMTATVH